MNNVSEQVPMSPSLPNTYCPDISDKWLNYEEWRLLYEQNYTYLPPRFTLHNGEAWYFYFLSSVDSNLSDDKIRILSAEINQSKGYNTIYVTEIYYHSTVEKKWVSRGWPDIKDELEFNQDREFITQQYVDATMFYGGIVNNYSDLLDILKLEYDKVITYEESV